MSAPVMLMVRRRGTRQVRPASCAVSGDTWWLVEAASADAAREVVVHFEHNGEPCVHGRVLWYGGRK